MNRNRIFLSLAIFSFLAFLPLHAMEDMRKKDNYFKINGMEHRLSLTVGGNSGEGFETYTIMAQPKYQLDMTHLQAYIGMQLDKGSYDCTIGATGWFVPTKKLRVGVEGIYHFNQYDDVSTVNDILANLRLETRPTYWFGFQAGFGYMYKSRKVFRLDNRIRSNDPTAFVEMDFYLPCNFTVYARAASYELYRYPIFCAPSFTAGVKFEPTKRLFFGFEASARYVDFFTISTYHDSNEYRVTIGVRL